ncbi:hypothetical protein nbrc107697_31510 [Gordonia crocea]|uniref:Uncharacterized protein n=2 Tax=Gordonia crocea TaxID=589162 RepID=A0A7I9V1Q2_9ACTN|nr:hypothetical protein nbrc107697_31510 [Gordonia crocea]
MAAAVAVGVAAVGAGTADAAPPSAFLGSWDGHGRQVVLAKNGSATVSLASGAANVEKWTAKWGPAEGRVDLSFVKRTAQHGDTAGFGVAPGKHWLGRLVTVQGYTVLEFNPGLPGIYWCRPDAGRAGVCGA